MAPTDTEGQCQSLGTHLDTSKYGTFRAKSRRDGGEACEGSLLQGMGSLPPHLTDSHQQLLQEVFVL